VRRAFLLAAALCAVSAGASAANSAQSGDAKVIAPNELKWGDAPPSMGIGEKVDAKAAHALKPVHSTTCPPRPATVGIRRARRNSGSRARVRSESTT
jgi:hypothetical protein